MMKCPGQDTRYWKKEDILEFVLTFRRWEE